jgi:hypothetical protein
LSRLRRNCKTCNHQKKAPLNFCKTLRDVQGAITRAELLKRMRASLKHEGYDQIPQLECLAAAKKKKLLE